MANLESGMTAQRTAPDLQGPGKMRNQRRSRFAQRKEPRRSIEVVSFLRHSLADHIDTLIRMVDRRIS
jgi:hypothetical protein